MDAPRLWLGADPCFPEDTKALLRTSVKVGHQLTLLQSA